MNEKPRDEESQWLRQTGGVAALPEPLPRIVGEFNEILHATLRHELVGAYLYGSAVAGGFEPEASDFDVVVVTVTKVDQTPLATFQGSIDRLTAAEPDWADRLDITFVDRHTLATFRSGGALLSISHDEPLRRFEEADDWLETWFLVRTADTSLLGPPAAELIPFIEPSEFVTAIVKGAAERDLQLSADSRSGPRAYLVLTLGRTLRSLETGAPCSKVEGAAAIVDHHPDARAVAEECLSIWRSRGRASFSRAAEAYLPRLIERLLEDIDTGAGHPPRRRSGARPS